MWYLHSRFVCDKLLMSFRLIECPPCYFVRAVGRPHLQYSRESLFSPYRHRLFGTTRITSGFLAFFLTMFGSMVFQTYLVAAGAKTLTEGIRLLWTFRVPWGWAYTAGTVSDWAAQFAFGFYSLMLTSTIIGLLVMALYKPRSWCTFCPMGTMTQTICKIKHRNEAKRP